MSDVAGDTQRPEADAARFDLLRARIALVLGPALFLLLWFLPLPLPDAAQRLAAVMALVVVFWIGEPVPVAVTALLAPCLALLAGAVPAGSAGGAVRAAFGGFGDPILMLFVGGFFIAEAMTVHGVDRRLAMSILSLRAFSASPARMVVGLGLCSWVLSMWMSNTATTALLIPIAIGMLRVARAGAPPGRLDTSVMLMLPFASTVGGLATPVGTAPNIIGIGQMEKLPGVDFGFLTWMGYGVSIGALMIVALAILLTRGLPAAAADLRGHAVAERSRMGGWSRGERVTVLAFSLAVGGWVFTGLAQAAGWKEIQAFMSARLPEGAIALLAASVLFMIPSARGRRTLTWGEAARIDWGRGRAVDGGTDEVDGAFGRGRQGGCERARRRVVARADRALRRPRDPAVGDHVQHRDGDDARPRRDLDRGRRGDRPDSARPGGDLRVLVRVHAADFDTAQRDRLWNRADPDRDDGAERSRLRPDRIRPHRRRNPRAQPDPGALTPRPFAARNPAATSRPRPSARTAPRRSAPALPPAPRGPARPPSPPAAPTASGCSPPSSSGPPALLPPPPPR